MNCGDKLFSNEKKWILKAGKMAQQLRLHSTPEIKSLASTIGSSHLLVTLPPKDLMSSEDFHGYFTKMHILSHIQRLPHILKNKIFTNPTSDGCLISKKYKELKKRVIKRTINPIRNGVQT